MSKIGDGGPAFTFALTDGVRDYSCGMSLRDYFAAKAMQALLMGDVIAAPFGRKCEDITDKSAVADLAYATADAMLKERAKQ